MSSNNISDNLDEKLTDKKGYYVFRFRRTNGTVYYNGYVKASDKSSDKKISEASDYFNSLEMKGQVFDQVEFVDSLESIGLNEKVVDSWDSIKRKITPVENKDDVHALLHDLSKEGVDSDTVDELRKELDFKGNRAKFEQYMQLHFKGDEKLEMAYNICIEAHDGVPDQGFKGVPYHNHPIQMANIAIEILGIKDSALLQGLLLHDVPEDTHITEEDLAVLFGEDVMEIVKDATRLDGESRGEFIDRVKNNPRIKSKIAKCLDRYNNLIRSFSMNEGNYKNNKRTFKEYLQAYVNETEEIYIPAFENIKELEPLKSKFHKAFSALKKRLEGMR